jgi:hypothetical protein
MNEEQNLGSSSSVSGIDLFEKKIDSEFFSQNFKPEQYVKDLFIKGGPLKAKLKASQLNDAKTLTSEELIKNVYTNYRQFIDTSQQISILETDMLQLRSLVGDYESILKSISDIKFDFFIPCKVFFFFDE